MTRDKAAELIENSELEIDPQELISILRPSILIRTQPIEQLRHPLASRFGGPTVLPPDINRPAPSLDFLAQINLADLPTMNPGLGLPDHGRLMFFYNTKEHPWGFDPKHQGNWKVMYIANESDSALVEGEDGFPPHSVTFEPQQTIPSAFMYNDQEISADSDERLEELLESLTGSEQTIHRLCGFAEPIQGPMEMECQLVSNGVYCGGSELPDDPKVKALEMGAHDWRLLLQLDTEDSLWMWGDSGRLYFWIRNSDLAQMNFENVWCILQCF